MLHLHLSIFLTFIAALFPYETNAIVSHKDLFQYGLQNGDSELPKIYPVDGPRISLNFVELDPKFTLFGKSANLFAVRDDGTFIIRDAAPSGFVGEIRVFSANVDLRKCGSVFWRKSTSNTDLNKAQDEIGLAFPAYKGLRMKYAVIATWYQVSPGRRTLQTWFDKSDSTGNTSTFQGILTTDGHHSFVIFNYNQIGFVKSNGRSGTVGFSVPGSTYDYIGSRITYIATESNSDKSGRWVYRVDQGTIYEPSSVCPIAPQPDNGSCMAEDYTPESVAHCTCKDGFKSDTEMLSKELRCSRKADNKTVHWTGNVPVCTTLIQTTAQSPQPSADPSDSTN